MICVSVSDKNIDNCLSALSMADMAELRLDLIKPGRNALDILFDCEIPLIATYRKNGANDDKRMEMLTRAIESGASYVDIDIEEEVGFNNEIVNTAKKHGSRVIVSYHNYDFTPDERILSDIIENCFAVGANIVKIACMPRKSSDAAKLLGLYKDNTNLIAFGMGERGKLSRIASLFLGAPFAYASVSSESATAPGQYTYEKMKKILNLLEFDKYINTESIPRK